jgi:hypothetical protein
MPALARPDCPTLAGNVCLGINPVENVHDFSALLRHLLSIIKQVPLEAYINFSSYPASAHFAFSDRVKNALVRGQIGDQIERHGELQWQDLT